MRRALPLVPVDVVQRRLDPHPHEVGPARRWTVRQAASAGITDEDAAAVLELLSSELITNAVRHGEGEVVVSVVRNGTTVGVAVTDAGDGRPAPRDAERDAVTGRGMLLVAALSESWGVEHHPMGGTCVWFTVPRTTTTPADAPRCTMEE
ncbi:MAG: ATP-binding protein [Actinotalea sp.]|nr:ATP-binding protein [Actinotalea sp.]